MLMKVWEVYKYNSLECIAFKTRALAEKQTVMGLVEEICEATVDFSHDEILKLNAGEPVWL